MASAGGAADPPSAGLEPRATHGTTLGVDRETLLRRACKRETRKVIQSAHDYQQHTCDNVNMAWDQVICGVTTIQDIYTKERADVDTNHVDWWLRVLNEHGYQYREVRCQNSYPEQPRFACDLARSPGRFKDCSSP